jgi:hypothetical protein
MHVFIPSSTDALKSHSARIAVRKEGEDTLSPEQAHALATTCKELHAITEVRGAADVKTMNLTWRAIATIVTRYAMHTHTTHT